MSVEWSYFEPYQTELLIFLLLANIVLIWLLKLSVSIF